MVLHRMLAEARRLAGLSQRELAERAGTSQATIARYEAGTVSPTLRTFERLVATCGYRLEPRMTRADPQLDRQIRRQLALAAEERVDYGLQAGRQLDHLRGLARARDAR